MDKVKKLTFVSLFAALIAVSGFISIPLPGTPIPIVLQNMLVVLTGVLLGPVLGTSATVLFLLLGALGLPIFSGGTGGIARFLGPTGGFLYGYAIATLVASLIARRPSVQYKTSLKVIILSVVVAFVSMYVPGVIHFMLTLKKSLKDTMILCVLPYIPLDIVKMVLCVILGIKLRPTVARVFFDSDLVVDSEDGNAKQG